MLIIFDCDGVLVDSEGLASEVFSSSLAKIGIFLSAQDCFDRFQGQSLASCFDWLEANFDSGLPNDFPALLERDTELEFTRQLKSVAGVESVLKYLLGAEVKFCVASNGGHKKIFNSLSTTGLMSYFDHRFSVDDVELGKPNPDLFLYAAKSMGELPGEVLVVEDSRAGWQAARAAEMEVFLYAPHGKPEFTNENIFTVMDELISIIKTKMLSGG